MTTFSSTSRRLILAFSSLVVLFGASSYVALTGLEEVHASLHNLKHHERRVHTARQLKSAALSRQLRWTSRAGDPVADPHFEPLLERLRAEAGSSKEKEWIDGVASANIKLEALSRAGGPNEGGELETQFEVLLDRIDHIISELEVPTDIFEQHAGLVEHSTFRWTLVFLVTSVLFAVGVGVYIGRSVARPMAHLEMGARRLTDGDLSTRIEVLSSDEFGRLAEQFNRMAESLLEHQERLVHSERLASIGRFAAGVAHEINNPLCVILGYVRLLRKMDESHLEAELSIIEEEALACQVIVEGLLDLARPFEVDGVEVELRAICEEVIERLQESSMLEGIELSLKGSGVVEGNSRKLRQVVVNLVTNAAQATNHHGLVRIEIQRGQDQWLTMTVEDNGSGVPAEILPRLYDPFFTTRPDGVGLGLAVSQSIVHAHGGSIGCHSVVGGATVFTVRLPQSPKKVTQ